jgi:hypothetical protein
MLEQTRRNRMTDERKLQIAIAIIKEVWGKRTTVMEINHDLMNVGRRTVVTREELKEFCAPIVREIVDEIEVLI